ncbi:hypothetical protein BGZ83_000483 [Gryganskiella cystojenkinii]|nr:hypothetical protein BGZ83_000483 [Gryganskiella cystojenkinii]
MSSADKDKKPETDATVASDLNIVDDEEPATTPITTKTEETTKPASSAKPSSPQATKESPFGDDEDDEDLEVHPAVSSTTTTAAATVIPPIATTTIPVAATAPAPAQSEREAKLAILTEAFPSVEKEVCEFVLESHRGDVEASINALLEISDPEFQAPAAPAPAPVAPSAPPALPRRQVSTDNDLAQGVTGMNLGGQQQPREIDPILLASTSTPEQQLRADEDFARTLAAMDEYRARDQQNVRQQQQQQQDDGPSFTTELKELMDEELPKIKERFNVAADTTKKKVSEWYNQFKANRAEAAARSQQNNQNNQNNQAHYDDGYRGHPNSDRWETDNNRNGDRDRHPIRFDSRLDDDEPLARNRVTPPLGDSTPPSLPSRPYNVASTTTTPGTDSTNSTGRRTTVEEGTEEAS